MDPFESDIKKSEFFLDGESERESLDSINQRIEKISTKKEIFTLSKVLLLAASFIGVLAMSLFFFKNSNSSLQSIAINHFAHFPNFVEIQVRGDYESSILKDAYAFYDKEVYGLAIVNYNKANGPLNTNDVFYLSIALLGERRWEEAYQRLISLDGELDAEYLEAYQFYLSLSLIGLGQKDAAIEELEKMTNKRSPFYEKATILKKNLSRKK